MSTVVYRDGILCADTRGFSGHKVSAGQKNKISTTKAGHLIGVCTSTPGQGEAFMRWLQGDRLEYFESDKDLDFSAIEVLRDGTYLLYENSEYPTGPLEGDFFAIGSGAYFAIGAMEAGCNALGALEVAAIHDVWTGAPYTVLNLADVKVEPPAPPKADLEDDGDDFEDMDDD